MSVLRATYRLQLTPEAGFAAARELTGYLRDLGISHLYLSPTLQAREGSTHGYDIIDPGRISEDLGGEAGLRDLAAEGLGLILDVVPNHLGRDDANRFWADPELREQFFDLDHGSGGDPPPYRRFFDIDDLAAIRIEDPEVFHAVSDKILSLVREGLVDGLRVDHPDGLADPEQYLGRLREAGAERVWVEKILHPGEPMRAWPVSGTVGYEFLNDVAGLFLDPRGEAPLTAMWHAVSGDTRDFAAVALEAQLEQARGPFEPEVSRLARLDDRFDAATLADGLARLPIYRTYAQACDGAITDVDRAAIKASGMDPALAAVLTLDDPAPAELVTRFQQTSPAITAKGTEDTAFYRYLRLLTLCEVGGDPGRFGVSVADFHAGNEERQTRFPEALLTTMTHDAKRSADVRARIGILASIPERWGAFVDAVRTASGGGFADRVEEQLVLQTLVGTFPIEDSRLEEYLVKALREAKRTSNWLEPDEAHERSLVDWATGLLADEGVLELLRPFADEVAQAGERVGAGYVLLKLTCPGVPDVYQGDELTSLSLVDPDNRRPVDWTTRRRALADLRAGAAPTRETAKLHVLWRALDLRARRAPSFGAGSDGAYTPLDAGRDVCAFARGTDVLVVAGLRDWDDATLVVPEALRGDWEDVLRDGSGVRLGQDARVGDVVGSDGFALLERVA